MTAIPTKYNGTQFRSRLEARWAAFFDLIGLEWEYEPLDLSGYIPDFILPNLFGSHVALVEVKPIVSWPCAVVGCTSCNPADAATREEHDDAIAKIKRSGWNSPAFLVGAVFPPAGQLGRPWARRVDSLDPLCHAELFVECTRCGLLAGIANVAAFDSHGRIAPTDCACGSNFRAIDLSRPWREAGNRVQWHGAGAMP